MFAPVRTVAPAALVTTAEAKAQLRVDHSDDDVLIDSLVSAATAHLDGWTGILGSALVTQTWRQDYSCFHDRMAFPLAPVQSLSSVTYYDADDAVQTLAGSGYRLLTDALGPYVARTPAASWPSVGDRDAPISITFVAGYGTPAQIADPTHAASEAFPLKQAVLLHVQRLYDALDADALTKNQRAYDALIAPYRRIGL